MRVFPSLLFSLALVLTSLPGQVSANSMLMMQRQQQNMMMQQQQQQRMMQQQQQQRMMQQQQQQRMQQQQQMQRQQQQAMQQRQQQMRLQQQRMAEQRRMQQQQRQQQMQRQQQQRQQQAQRQQVQRQQQVQRDQLQRQQVQRQQVQRAQSQRLQAQRVAREQAVMRDRQQRLERLRQEERLRRQADDRRKLDERKKADERATMSALLSQRTASAAMRSQITQRQQGVAANMNTLRAVRGQVPSGAGAQATNAARTAQASAQVARNAALERFRARQAAAGAGGQRPPGTGRVASNDNHPYPPNYGFAGKSVPKTLQPGTMIDRYGKPTGTYLSPAGTPFAQRSLSSTLQKAPLTRYRVIKPLSVLSGKAATWYDKGNGGGTQYKSTMSVEKLLREKFIEKVD